MNHKFWSTQPINTDIILEEENRLDINKEISQIKANNLYFRLLETQYLHFH